MSGMRGEARINIEAKPEEVYDLVTDVARMGEWSPECVRAYWVSPATGPAPGAKFRGHNRRGWMRWRTTPTVTDAEPGKLFAFDTGDTRWRYELREIEGGTEVVESFEAGPQGKLLSMLVGSQEKRERELVAGMEQTLARLKAAAERRPR